jgi:Zn-dependent metalloprotease
MLNKKIRFELLCLAKKLATCAFLIYNLIVVCEFANAKEPDIAGSLNLIPLPPPPTIELPLTGFNVNQDNTIADPGLTKITDRLREFVNGYKSLQINGNNLNPLRALSSAKHPRLQSSYSATANLQQSNQKKPLPTHLAYLLPRAGSNIQGLISAQSSAQSNDILEIKMRSIGTPRQIKVNTHKGVQNMMPQTTVSATVQDDDEQVARTFLNLYRGHLRLDNPDNELSLTRKEKDDLNRQHLRFSQSFSGLPVWPAELIAHLDAQGNIDLVDGAFIPTPRDLSIKPELSAEEAIFAARTYLPGSEKAKVSQPELIVYGALDNPARLAWKLKLDVSIQSQFIVVVDAINAQILNTFNTVQHQNVGGSGIDLFGSTRPLNIWQVGNLYYLDDTSKFMFDLTSTPPNPSTTRGAIIITDARNQPPTDNPKTIPSIYLVTSNNSNSSWLKDGVSAAFNLSKVYDYYLSRHARNSIDGQGGSISAIVRFGQNLINAFWYSDLNTMFFGDAAPFAGVLDVVAHEMTHGVTANTAALIPGTQPGAMNEGFSDIFGSSVEAYVSGSTDWIMGTQLGAGKTSRNLKDPSHTITGECGTRPYPSKMSEYVNSSNDENGDYGGVHCNSTVLSHAYYLLAQGLANAIGIRDAERIFYRALTVHLTQQAQFIDARLACIQSATELFGSTSTQAIKTAQAFDAVEIVDATPSPQPNPTPPVSGTDATLFFSYYDQDNAYLARRETALGDGTLGSWLSTSAIAGTRPSVTADGSMAVFVTADHDLCFINTDDDSTEACLNSPGLVHSVAMSPDGKHFGFVMLDASGNPDNKIIVMDINTSSTREYALIAPASEGQTTDSIEMADSMTFTSNNRFLIYDALNVISLNDGTQISAWSIFAIDFVTGQTLLVVPPTPGYDIGFPAIGHTSDDFITFEALNLQTNQTTIIAGNLRTGKSVTVGTVNFATFDYAVPSFAGDDTAITYSVPDTNTMTLHSINKQPLASDHMTPNGNALLWLVDADFAINYRRGAYQKLTVTNSNIANGVVISNIGGINCGDTCSMIYPKGTAVNLTAKASAGSTFTGWGGACSGTGICAVNMGQDLVVNATFINKAAIGIPASLKVPVSDSDGVYTVSWTASATSGVTYVLEEATNNTFSAGLRVAYTGTGLSAAITGRARGVTYYYRVKAKKIGYIASAPRVATNGCRVL